MSQKFEKLKTLLKELFQLDQPDLDFGLYRIMHAKSAEVTQFLDRDLLPQVKEEFGKYKTADKSEVEKELAKAVEQAQALGADPETLPKVKELKEKLKSGAVDIAALESEVYDHLFGFFRRYYSEGDFLSKRVYKPGVYAIPYEGEEVTLHWANADQYYIKTSEYLRDYAFRLRPDDDANPMRVHFRLVDAAEGEHGNVKTVEGKDRVFLLAATDFIAEEAGGQGPELAIRFEYRPATLFDWPDDARGGKTKPPTQKDLTALAEARVLSVADAAFGPWLTELRKAHVKVDGEQAEYTRLRAHLNRYVARNTFDYFIHKDLGAFLKRELDFYIKNEVMHLDDVEHETAPRVEQYLSKIKVIRRIAGKIIAFLAQLEDFQKKLWMKKKFVVETHWCVALKGIPDEFHAEIEANSGQLAEWKVLCGIQPTSGKAKGNGGLFDDKSEGIKLSGRLRLPGSLMIDTNHFPADFTSRLLETIGDLDAKTDGVLFHSENFQALRLMQARYQEKVKCVYIDPPYNTGNDGFDYKDSYQHSSWISALAGRLAATRILMEYTGTVFTSIADHETHHLRLLQDTVFGADNFIATIIWHKMDSPKNTAVHFSEDHDYISVFARDGAAWRPNSLPRTPEMLARYTNPDEDPRGPWLLSDLAARNFYAEGRYEIRTPSGRIIQGPPAGSYWRVSRSKFDELDRDKRIHWGSGDSRPGIKRFLSEVREGVVPQTYWSWKDVGSTRNAKQALSNIMVSDVNDELFITPKPCQLVERILRIGGADSCESLDFFAGSGTTGHAVINLNREDGGRRKVILVEMADYFDSVLVPRLKKVAFTPEWKGGQPKRAASAEEIERGPRIFKIVRLESYEDTLNNLVPPRRTQAQQSLLVATEAQGADRLKEQYMLRYMLDVETANSPSLLNVPAFTDPTAYRLKVKRPGSDESREVNVDLLETFNWLIGLTVQHIAAPQCFTAKFERDSEQRLRLKGRLKQDDAGSWWFRTVTGTTPDGRKTLVIWRKRPGGETPEGVEQDNLVLDEWFTRQGYSSKDSEFALIYINGTNNLENLRAPDDTWKVRLIEEDFHRLMFATEGM
jgi:adenine-specific DNA-methyltransferase